MYDPQIKKDTQKRPFLLLCYKIISKNEANQKPRQIPQTVRQV